MKPRKPERKTARTHVISTEGKLYRVHDGSTEEVTIEIDGQKLEGLEYTDARKAKDIAVVRGKYRKATIAEMPVALEVAGMGYDTVGRSPGGGIFAGEGNPSDPANVADPVLASAQQAALAAARPVAAAAQARHEALRKPPVVENHPKTPIVGIDPIPGDDDSDLGFDEGGIDDVAVADLLADGSKPTGDDAQRAARQAQADAENAEAAGKELFAREKPDADWGALSEADRQSYRWRALNEADVRVGDVVMFHSVYENGGLRQEPAIVVAVISRDVVNLQLGVNPDTKIATGATVTRVSRDEGTSPSPNTWALIV